MEEKVSLYSKSYIFSARIKSASLCVRCYLTPCACFINDSARLRLYDSTMTHLVKYDISIDIYPSTLCKSTRLARRIVCLLGTLFVHVDARTLPENQTIYGAPFDLPLNPHECVLWMRLRCAVPLQSSRRANNVSRSQLLLAALTARINFAGNALRITQINPTLVFPRGTRGMRLKIYFFVSALTLSISLSSIFRCLYFILNKLEKTRFCWNI